MQMAAILMTRFKMGCLALILLWLGVFIIVTDCPLQYCFKCTFNFSFSLIRARVCVIGCKDNERTLMSSAFDPCFSFLFLN